MRALSVSVILRPCSPVSHGHFSGVAGPNKHDILLGLLLSQKYQPIGPLKLLLRPTVLELPIQLSKNRQLLTWAPGQCTGRRKVDT